MEPVDLAPSLDDAASWAADMASATAIARRYLGEKGRSPAELARRRRADALLYVELGVQIAVTYALVYGQIPRSIAALLLAPWSIYSALSVDNVIHYTNHWSPSKSPAVNVALRALFLPLLVTPLEIRHVHWEHHRYNDIEVDQRTWMRSIACRARGARASVLVYAVTEVWSSLRASVPWAQLAPPLERLREKRPLHHLEIRAVRWVCLLWLAALVALRPFDTLCLFVPAVVVVPLFASLLMNLTDHLPSTLTHPFRQATYLEPSGARERLYAAMNRQSAATHLTHHLFPQVHWTERRRRRARPGRRAKSARRGPENPTSFPRSSSNAGASAAPRAFRRSARAPAGGPGRREIEPARRRRSVDWRPRGAPGRSPFGSFL